jgi:hypothetical protein
MGTKQEAANNGPSNWRVTSNDGTTVSAVNLVTGAVFSGKLADFNLLTAATFNTVADKAAIYDHNQEHITMGSPQTLWASGQVFWMPPGDGGANGLMFTGGGTGNFTLSAAVVTGFIVPQGWIYLPLNVGGLTNPAGWYYFTMSTETAGKIHTTMYDSTSGVPPVFPNSPVEMAFTSNVRLTSTTSEIQCMQVSVDYAKQMGINGCIEAMFSMAGNTAASTKNVRMRAGAYALHEASPTTSPQGEFLVSVSSAGSLTKQSITKWAASVGNAPSPTLSNNYRVANLAAETTLNFNVKTTLNTDSVACIIRKIAVTYGA